MGGMEFVSVLIPAWNSASWVGEAIESALAQTHSRLEVVAVDDGSTDGTSDALRRFGERIRWESTSHRGANAARNRLLELAHGEWVQYLDADDLLLPRKIERQLAATRAAGDADLVASPYLSPAGEVLRRPHCDDPWLCFLEGRLGTTSSHLFRRETLVRIGGWEVARRAAQEQELLQRLLASGARVAFVEEALCIKRRVNPRSLWRSIWRDDPKAAREADLSPVAAAVRHLRDEGELTPEREAAAGARFLVMARSAWRRGAGGWEDVLAEAEALQLPERALLSESSALYRAVYRAAGFHEAESLAQAGPRIRRWQRTRRQRLRRFARRARGIAAGALRRLH
jgi:hypothetical protein